MTNSPGSAIIYACFGMLLAINGCEPGLRHKAIPHQFSDGNPFIGPAIIFRIYGAALFAFFAGVMIPEGHERIASEMEESGKGNNQHD
jgi:hypothetical protein